ncbi:MAG: Gfo/Idh/MocA family oxidoreductase [Treponema sp.]|jgi:predicted dehydrogenase|nr:Gfo/Idh/MocA family oxidoreductase [Treponema sp.]
MEKIRAAIIGLGRIASLLEDDRLREKPCTHAGAIAADPDCLLTAGCDRDGERRRLFAERWKAPVYADAAAMLDAGKPQILVIATHPDSHAGYCGLAAARGVPVLVCEKPLADTLRRARYIARLAASRGGPVRGGEGRGTRILVNHERRYSADYVRARAILAEGRMGALSSVRAVLYMGKNKRLLDVLWHDGTHLADAIMYLSGSVMRHKKAWGARLTGREGTAWLSGLLIRNAVPPAAAGSAPAAGRGRGVPVPFIVEIGAGRDHLVFEMEFSCERGRLRIGNGIFEVWESRESPYAEGFRSLEKTGETFEGKTGYFSNMIADAAACVRDPLRQPKSSAADGLRVIEYLRSVRAW